MLLTDPLGMTQGDVHSNLLGLLDWEVTEPNVKKMKQLLLSGVPMAQLEAALMLLREAPCAAQLVEEAHSCAAWNMREHPTLNEASLLVRGTLAQVRSCFMESRVERAIDRIDDKLSGLARKQPQNISERHLFLGATARAAAPVGTMNQQGALATTRRCMKERVAMFNALDPVARVEWARARDQEVGRQRVETQQAIDALLAEKAVLRGTFEDKLANDGVPNQIGTQRLEEHDLAIISAMLADQIGSSWPKEMWSASCASPLPPTVAAQHCIEESASRLLPASQAARPWWVSRVALHRKCFQGVAFCRRHDRRTAYRFLFAKQRSICATFLGPRRRGIIWPDLDDAAMRHPMRCRPWNYVEYDFLPAVCNNEVGLGFNENDQLMVLEGLQFSGWTLRSCHKPIPFERFVAKLPMRQVRADAAPRSSAPRVAGDKAQALLDKYPWLSMEDIKPSRPQRAPAQRRCADSMGGSASKKRKMVEGTESEDKPGDCMDVQQGAATHLGAARDAGDAEGVALGQEVRGELLALRSEWGLDMGDAQEFFFLGILGGSWTLQNRGVLADSVGGFAKPGLAKEWCRSFEFPMQQAYAFARYGREPSNQLAQEFVRRAALLFKMWLDGAGSFEYRQEHIDAYTKGDEWRTWVASLNGGDRWATRRVAEVRRLSPRLGAAYISCCSANAGMRAATLHSAGPASVNRNVRLLRACLATRVSGQGDRGWAGPPSSQPGPLQLRSLAGAGQVAKRGGANDNGVACISSAPSQPPFTPCLPGAAGTHPRRAGLRPSAR